MGIWQVLHHWCGETDALGEKITRYSLECCCNKCQCSSEQLFRCKRWQHGREWGELEYLLTANHLKEYAEEWNQRSIRRVKAATSGQKQRLAQERMGKSSLQWPGWIYIHCHVVTSSTSCIWKRCLLKNSTQTASVLEILCFLENQKGQPSASRCFWPF